MDLLIYCSGGFAKEVIDLARRMNDHHQRWQEIAFVDERRSEREHYGARVLKIQEIENGDQFEAVVANGEPLIRKKLRQELENKGLALATLVDPTAVVSATARLSPGCVIFPGCFISSQAVLEHNVAMIANSTLGHNTVVGADTMISGLVNIGGGCKVGNGAYIGMGSQLKEGTNIGKSTIIGMGSIVYNDIPEGVTALGNPCRPMQKNTAGYVFHRQ